VMTNTTQIEYYPVYHLQSDVISAWWQIPFLCKV
jgi:hypothetical protein